MANLQDDYSQYQGVGFPGMIATSMYRDTETGIVNDGADAIVPGAAVASVQDGKRVAVGASTAFAGVAVDSVLDANGLITATRAKGGYEPGDRVPLLRNGVIWVIAFDAVTPATVPQWGSDGTIGGVVAGAQSFPGVARFLGSAAAGELVQLKIEA